MPPIPPIRTDFFSFAILLGALQGILLSFFFLRHYKRNQPNQVFLGLLMLSMSLIMIDVWLGYTNYMFYTLWLVDSTEPLNFVMAPLTYLFVRTGLSYPFRRKDWLHFLPAAIYLIYMCLLIYPQSLAFEYNSNVGAFHPEMARLPSDTYGDDWMFFLKEKLHIMLLLSLAGYSIALHILLRKKFAEASLPFTSNQDPKLAWYRKSFFELIFLLLALLIVRLTFAHDLGDHIVVSFLAIVIYLTSYRVVRDTLENNKQAVSEVREIKKYEKSSLTKEIQNHTLKRFNRIMAGEKPYLDSSFSLPGLAKQLGVSTHHLSQILNEEIGGGFFDITASYRIAEAQKLLLSEDNNHLKIEEIAEKVGYNSKSAFNTAFRKITGQTPSEYRKTNLI